MLLVVPRWLINRLHLLKEGNVVRSNFIGPRVFAYKKSVLFFKVAHVDENNRQLMWNRIVSIMSDKSLMRIKTEIEKCG